jgi:hypothetical protein
VDEQFLYYIWQYKQFNTRQLSTKAGEPVSIIHSGQRNTDAGPDFSMAKVKIGNTLWVGNVEIHVNASDWKLHSHDGDKNYENIILHVVYNDDVKNSTNKHPCLELKNYIDKTQFTRYRAFMQTASGIPCSAQINSVDKFIIDNWLDRLLVERLEHKTELIRQGLLLNHNNWEETFYHALAKNFGAKINSEPFELLAKSLPLKILAKHKNNLLQLEALLFGTAGLLQDNYDDAYYLSLKKEFSFLQKKYKLQPLEKHLWKFLRLRPANFPTIRIAQFAQLVHQSSHLFSKILEVKNKKELYKLFNCSPSAYWDEHYIFGKKSKLKSKSAGESFIDLVIINTVAPFIFYYGKQRDDDYITEKSLKLLANVKPEDNRIIKEWELVGIKAHSAAESQALIELKNNFCNHKRCLQCAVGHRLLRSKE